MTSYVGFDVSLAETSVCVLDAGGKVSRGAKSKAIGECWDNRCSSDGHFEIFIRPDLAHAADAMPAQIAAILAHELVHAAAGIPTGHGKAFGRVAVGLG